MLVTKRKRKTREFHGPTPHSVAIVAKMPTGRPLDHMLEEHRKKEALIEEALRVEKYNKMFSLKNDWELNMNLHIENNTVRRRVRAIMEQSKLEIDERKQRLRQLLAEEDSKYLEEMEAKHETIEERQKKMFDRAKELKEKRETERLKIVEDKLDQQWRGQCEELRSVLSRRHQDEVCVDRMHQLAIKADLEQRKIEEEKMYAELWERDRLAKAAREEMEAQQQIERNRSMVDTLGIQKASLEAKKQEEKELIAEEAKLLAEERELRKLEETRGREQKRLLQQKQRSLLDTCVKYKLKREAQDRQEELALDMKILEQLLEESRNEAQELLQRKMQRKEEEQKYREYLHNQLEEEKRREKELDKLVDADVAAMWEKRTKQWKLEKEARNRLMQDVMETRRRQLHDKLRTVAIEKEELIRDKEEMTKAIEEHNKMEDERITRVKRINKDYESDLLAQIEHVHNCKHASDLEEIREYEEGLKMEAKYQAKLKQVLSDNSSHPNIHPMRRQKQPQFEVVGSQLK